MNLTASMARVVACDVRTFSRPAKFLSVVASETRTLRQLLFPR